MAVADVGAIRTRTLARMMSMDALLFAIVFVIVPNLPSMAMWYFITPRRLFAVPGYLLAGLLAVRAPLWVGALMLLLAAVIDVLFIISGMFDLSPRLVLDAIQYAPILDLGGSWLYLGLGAIMVATVAAMVWMTHRYRPRLRDASPLLALLFMFAWMAVDAVANVSINRVFGQHMGSLVEFDSAVRKSGLTETNPAGSDRNLLIVVVEGMGAYADPRHTRLLTALMDRPAVRTRYEISSGTSPYLGSTSGATARELCGEWGDYRTYRDGPPKPCLPYRLAQSGYESIAVHGFYENFFERAVWYPKIGFNRLLFGEQLVRGPMREVSARCGLTFKGLCDCDVGEVVRGLLTEKSEQPRFVYWLTLNSHMPFNIEESTRRFGCANAGGAFEDKTTCYLSEMWADIIDQTMSIATDPELPRTDVLIVGDHHTPLFTRTARSLFTPGEVAWFALKSKESEITTTAAQGAANVQP